MTQMTRSCFPYFRKSGFATSHACGWLAGPAQRRACCWPQSC